MKKMRKMLTVLLTASMLSALLGGCGGKDSTTSGGGSEPAAEAPAADNSGEATGDTAEAPAAEGSGDTTADYVAGSDASTYVMISKTLSDPIFIDMYVGFSEFCEAEGINCMYRGTEEPTAEKEIEVISQLIAQGVDGLAVIASDFDALEPILTQAMGQGISVVPFDSAANPDSRQVHVEQASIDLVGRAQMDSALQICGGAGAEGTIGILSAQPESQLHADWCAAMLQEVEDKPDDYANITVLPIAYGDDLPDKSTTEAQAMLQNYPDLDVIISPTTVGILSAAKVIQDMNSDCKVTGVGLPSEMAPYIDNGICYDCYLWDPYDQGYLAAASVHSIATGESTGTVGDTVTAGRLGSYTVEEYYDGGTQVLLGDPIRFTKENINDYKDLF